MREDLIEIEIGAFAKIQNGYAFKSKEYVDKGLRIIRIANVQSGEIIDKDPKFYPESRLSEFSDYVIEEDDFLISLTGNVGRVGRINKSLLPALLNQRVGKLNLQTISIEKGYLYHFLNSRTFVHQVIKSSKGVAQLNTSSKKIEAIKIPIAPLPEQRAIVTRIEELFSDLDKGVADLKKAQDQLKVYRQAVLKKAFEGLDEVLFDQLITSSQNGIAKRRGSEGSETKVLRLADITNLEIDNSSPRSILLTQKEFEKYRLHEGDLLAIRVNGSIDLVGRFIHITKKDQSENWAFCDHLIRFTLDKERALSKFYFYFFQLPKVRKFIHENMVSSAGQNTVSQGTLRAISIPNTSLENQYKIVLEIESRLSVCDKVEESITKSLEKAKALRQSILKKAFEGTLLSKDEIEKCKTAPDYEPAAVLLKKIKNL